MKFDQLCDDTREVVRSAVDFIRASASGFDYSSVEFKGYNDLVSHVDRGSEKILVDGLKRLVPHSGFITEEATAGSAGEQFRWVIDPLDGTTNFVHGVRCYCVSVALMRDEQVVLGIVHEVNLDECFYAWQDAPAFLNGSEIKVSKRSTLADSLIVTGFPYTDFSRSENYMEVFNFLMRNTHGIRRPGSAAADLAYVASGRFEAFYEYGLNSWDVAAGAYIVQQAGGKVTDFRDCNSHLFGKEIIASNGLVHNEIARVIGDRMNR